MTKFAKYMGFNVPIDDDDELIQPDDQYPLITVLEKLGITDMRIKKDEDGGWTYIFDCKIPKEFELPAERLEVLGDYHE